MKKRIHILYSGNVQGVGFRFTAIRVANILGVKGWVKNLRNGRVEVTAEGEEEKLMQFLEKIRTGPLQFYIRDASVNWQECKGEFDNFDIRF